MVCPSSWARGGDNDAGKTYGRGKERGTHNWQVVLDVSCFASGGGGGGGSGGGGSNVEEKRRGKERDKAVTLDNTLSC